MATPEQIRAHELLDRLTPEQLREVLRSMETLVAGDPAPVEADHPEEDEEISEEEARAVAEAREWLRHNQPIPLQAVLSDFGLSTADWERLGQLALPPEPATPQN